MCQKTYHILINWTDIALGYESQSVGMIISWTTIFTFTE